MVGADNAQRVGNSHQVFVCHSVKAEGHCAGGYFFEVARGVVWSALAVGFAHKEAAGGSDFVAVSVHGLPFALFGILSPHTVYRLDELVFELRVLGLHG